MVGKQSPMRMFIMLPMMFLMGKIDFENETLLFAARTAFLMSQVIALLVGLYLKQLVQRKRDTRTIFVPGVKSPFDQSPNYAELTETTYEAYELAKANEFIKQTLIGAGISLIFSVVVMGASGMSDWKVNQQKTQAATGETTIAASTAVDAQEKKKISSESTPEEAIADTLAAGADADFDALWNVVKRNVNAKTDEDQWTALMVACGSPVDTDEFIKKVVKAGVNVLAVDGDGWTALHWSAFHGRPEAAEALLSSISVNKRHKLLAVKASDGRTAAEVAKGEENADVVAIVASFAKDGASDEETSTLRQRKAGVSSVEDVD
ncbi:unnamed protein product [Peronospora destructor]|uniref:Uncharacterized protein n=1 Tax=Peronospora destructor TaxID=86335 RepID=A0AAV0TF61_9STRA|nr:unnamed protein product [Peronospora destructor]